MKNSIKLILLCSLLILQACSHMEKKSTSCDFSGYKNSDISSKEDLTRE